MSSDSGAPEANREGKTRTDGGGIANGSIVTTASWIMRTEIDRLEICEAPAGGPALLVARADSGSTPGIRYAAAVSRGGDFPRQAALVAIARVQPLSAQDQIRVSAAAREDRVFKLEIEVRRYTGARLANVVTRAFVEMEVGSPEPGDYEAVAEVTTLSFDDIPDPERAANPQAATYRVQFRVA